MNMKYLKLFNENFLYDDFYLIKESMEMSYMGTLVPFH